jgi:purine-nucleoside phosphorylase
LEPYLYLTPASLFLLVVFVYPIVQIVRTSLLVTNADGGKTLGLGNYGLTLEQTQTIPYRDIPHFPQSTVPGHAGEMVFGLKNGRPVVAMRGRFHYYEGYPMAQVVFPIRVFQLLGIKNLIATNAAGGINHGFVSGDLMLISDHINFSGQNPLIGKNEELFGPRFPDMTRAYDARLKSITKQAAKESGLSLKEGVYAMMSGPSFETPAEIRMLRLLGADAVGMSTVPEIITAAHCGMAAMGLSCISNMAAGMLDQPLSHQEVIDSGKAAEAKFTKLIDRILTKI